LREVGEKDNLIKSEGCLRTPWFFLTLTVEKKVWNGESDFKRGKTPEKRPNGGHGGRKQEGKMEGLEVVRKTPLENCPKE